MEKPIWIGSPVDVRRGQDALDALAAENDVKYWDDATGITQVDNERWQKAQEYELATWLKHHPDAVSDRDHEHAALFHNYVALPEELGDVLEIGCGPFTQVRYILQQGKKARSLSLSDPLIEHYKNHPNCTYWGLRPSPHLIALPAEKILRKEQYNTIICINVLEHVCDAVKILENILAALRPGGHLVMGERTYDDLDVSKLYDVGHPIRIKSTVFGDIKAAMDIVFDNGDYFIARKR